MYLTEYHPICVAGGICQSFYLGWNINPYENSFFNRSGMVLFLPPHNAEVLNSCGVTHGVIVVINR